MIHQNTIRSYARRIAREFKPEKIVLFGSYAQGQPTKDSDVDLMVIMAHKGHSADAAVAVRQKLNAPFPLDLLVQSPDRIRKRLVMRDYFLRDVMTNGRVLYEAGNKRMD